MTKYNHFKKIFADKFSDFSFYQKSTYYNTNIKNKWGAKMVCQILVSEKVSQNNGKTYDVVEVVCENGKRYRLDQYAERQFLLDLAKETLNSWQNTLQRG